MRANGPPSTWEATPYVCVAPMRRSQCCFSLQSQFVSNLLGLSVPGASPIFGRIYKVKHLFFSRNARGATYLTTRRPPKAKQSTAHQFITVLEGGSRPQASGSGHRLDRRTRHHHLVYGSSTRRRGPGQLRGYIEVTIRRTAAPKSRRQRPADTSHRRGRRRDPPAAVGGGRCTVSGGLHGASASPSSNACPPA